MLPAATTDLLLAQQHRVAATSAAMAQLWRQMGEDFDASWAKIAHYLELLLASSMIGAAVDGAASVGPALEQQGITSTPEGVVLADQFGGSASDGRPLDSLLYGAVIHAKTIQADSTEQCLTAGGSWLDMAVQTQLADSARVAAGVGVTVRPRIEWVRVSGGNCCQRCAVLIGRVYRHSTGFERHPRCHCTMLPTTVAANTITQPDPHDIRDLTDAQRQALEDGADLAKVVNAYRNRPMQSLTTTEGRWRKKNARLTPEGIYKISATREEAIRRLLDNGYISYYS